MEKGDIKIEKIRFTLYDVNFRELFSSEYNWEIGTKI
jgi:hypothetical protein